MMKRLGCSC